MKTTSGRSRGLLKEYGIEEDPRFRDARHEAAWIVGLFVLNTVWVFGFAIWGLLTDQSAFPTVMGMQMWIAGALVGGVILYPVAGIVLALRLKECSLAETFVEETPAG